MVDTADVAVDEAVKNEAAALNDYLLDLRGYVVLESAVDSALLDELDVALEGYRGLGSEEWKGNVQCLTHGDQSLRPAFDLQNIVEGGRPFEQLIDHPSWVDYMYRWCGDAESGWRGLFIDECFATIRGEGGSMGIHSGGYRKAARGQYVYEDGVFRCTQINVLVALSEIGKGDGGTLIIPGSHKSRLEHPQRERYARARMDGMVGVVQPELRRGDVLIFTDAVAHGAATRTNPGERRTVIYRYGPRWTATRYGYQYSDELLSRVTPEQAKILQPVPPRRPPAGQDS